MTRLSHIVNVMVADVLATPGAKASAPTENIDLILLPKYSCFSTTVDHSVSLRWGVPDMRSENVNMVVADNLAPGHH